MRLLIPLLLSLYAQPVDARREHHPSKVTPHVLVGLFDDDGRLLSLHAADGWQLKTDQQWYGPPPGPSDCQPGLLPVTEPIPTPAPANPTMLPYWVAEGFILASVFLLALSCMVFAWALGKRRSIIIQEEILHHQPGRPGKPIVTQG